MDYPGKVISKNAVVPSQTSASGVWTLDDAAAAVESNTWPIAGVPNPISRSLRFNSADSAYLNRTPATAGNRRTWTWSGWVKRSALSATEVLLDAGTGPNTFFRFDANQKLAFSDYTSGPTYNIELISTQVLRDVSAWYHIVVAVDTTQATSTNRVKIYLNGSQITAFSTATYPSQNFDTGWNNATAHRIGSYLNNTSYLNGYLTEINFIDGQALTPSDFGMTDPQTGAWIPKAYTGTYGTNGFYLNFSDNASTAALGTDYSGNNNTWTTNNFSVTAGTGNDSMTDVPTPWWPYNTTGDVGGVVRGNYATMNPVAAAGGVTLTNGNLRASIAQKAAPRYISVSTIAFTGIVYAEVTITPGGGPNPSPSIGIKNSNYKSFEGSATTAGEFAYGFRDSSAPNILKDENGVSSTLVAGGSMSSGDVMMLAVDVAAGKMWLGKNGSWLASGNPATGANPAISGFSTTVPYWFFCATDQGTTTDNIFEWNFGQRPFAYTPPAGFLSLCTTNLPTPTILDGTDYFNTVLYTGNGTADGVQQAITGVGFAPDMVWLKSRSAATAHYVSDQVRGVNKTINTNTTGAEQTQTIFPAFGSDGFTVERQSTNAGVNENGATYVAWNWKAGGTPAVTNTDGTITSSISVNTTSGFSIVTYTANGTSGATVGHGLGVAPSMVVYKNRTSGGYDWIVYHASLGATKNLRLNTTTAQLTQTLQFNDTAPTSSVLTIGSSAGSTNGPSGNNYLAYCFAAVSGYSAFGSYTGNGSADGPFVFTGFRPAFVLVKLSSSAGGAWYVYDTSRNTYNVMDLYLRPDASDAENTFVTLDALSNGFKLRTSNTQFNGSGSTYIYAAFAENPFKISRAR